MEDRTVTYAQGAAIEAGGEAALSRLYVQDATGGTLTETTLVLSGIDESTSWFTDRPYREAGQITTAEFVELFSEEGANSFAENPPNADFTCESGGEVVNQAVTLTDPVFDETAGTLTYTAELLPTAGDDDFFAGITCDADAHLFIDDEAKARNWAYKMIGYRDGCYAAGGTWEPEKNKCIERYNCFIGGFCAELASLGYVSAARGNLYDGDKPGTPPASDAGCNESQGAIGWANGKLAANNPDRRIGMGPVCGCTYDPVDERVVLYPCANN